MPIINQVVKGSGGGSSVAEPYLEYSIDADGLLVSTTSRVVDLSGIKAITDNGASLRAAYKNNQNISGNIVFSDLEYIQAVSGLYSMFENCPNITGISFPKLKYAAGSQTMSSFASMNLSYPPSSIASANFPELEYVGDSNSWNSTFSNTSITNLSFPKLKYVTGWNYAFNKNSNLTSVSMPLLLRVGIQGMPSCFSSSGITTIEFPKLARVENNSLGSIFSNSSITEVRFSGLINSATGVINGAFNNMLSGTTNVTVHFPANTETLIKSFASYLSNFGGTTPTILFDLPSTTSVDLHEITEISTPCLNSVYEGATDITSADLSGLETANMVAGKSVVVTQQMFKNCTALTNVNLSSFVTSNASSMFNNTFEGCTSLVTMKFQSLKGFTFTGGAPQGFSNAFKGCTALTDVYFYALTTSINTSWFSSMLVNTSNVTVHMPANLTGLITASSFGGTNTTISFDLPSTFILTGADTNEYERNPKYDTATALSWRVNGSSVTSTAYYTSGTTDPSVGDTIYSDAACTTAVTTIGSIA